MKYSYLFLTIIYSITSAYCSVKSNSGQIKFDTDSDTQPEMILNSNGLGIGTSPSSNLHVQGNAIITGHVNIGTTSGSSNLNLTGSLSYGFQTLSSNTTLGASSLVLVDSSSANVKISLPYAGNAQGQIYHIKKINSANDVNVHGNFIDNSYAVSLPSGSLDYLKVISTGNQQWSILSTSGNGGLWTPADITTSAWYDASDFSSMSYNGSTGNVTQWNDKSGNDNHLTQADSDLQPILNGSKLEFVNGKVLSKSTATNMLIASGNHSIFFVHDVFDPSTSTVSFPNIIRNYSNAATFGNRRPIFFYNRSNNNLMHSYNSAGGAGSSISSYLGTRVISGSWDNGSGSLLVDGTSIATASIANTTETTHVSLTIGDNNDQNLTITFYEFIFLAQEIDTATNQKIEGYLAWKWGLEGNLANSHPYKAAPPSL